MRGTDCAGRMPAVRGGRPLAGPDELDGGRTAEASLKANL